jgi:uncharacterized protein (DUF305 family)
MGLSRSPVFVAPLLLVAFWAPAQAESPSVAPIIQPGAPGEPSKTLTSAAAVPLARPIDDADVEFMQGMIHHHAQAVEMVALLKTRGRDKALQAFGQRISISQTDEMEFMRQWLEERGKPAPMKHDMSDPHAMHHAMPAGEHGMSMASMDMATMPPMPGMLTPQQMQTLAKASGRAFDRLFLTGMIQHHTGALVMVEDLFGTAGAGQDTVLYDFATDVDNTQRAEIEIMERMLKGKK